MSIPRDIGCGGGNLDVGRGDGFLAEATAVEQGQTTRSAGLPRLFLETCLVFIWTVVTLPPRILVLLTLLLLPARLQWKSATSFAKCGALRDCCMALQRCIGHASTVRSPGGPGGQSTGQLANKGGPPAADQFLQISKTNEWQLPIQRSENSRVDGGQGGEIFKTNEEQLSMPLAEGDEGKGWQDGEISQDLKNALAQSIDTTIAGNLLDVPSGVDINLYEPFKCAISGLVKNLTVSQYRGTMPLEHRIKLYNCLVHCRQLGSAMGQGGMWQKLAELVLILAEHADSCADAMAIGIGEVEARLAILDLERSAEGQAQSLRQKVEIVCEICYGDIIKNVVADAQRVADKKSTIVSNEGIALQSFLIFLLANVLLPGNLQPKPLHYKNVVISALTKLSQKCPSLGAIADSPPQDKPWLHGEPLGQNDGVDPSMEAHLRQVCEIGEIFIGKHPAAFRALRALLRGCFAQIARNQLRKRIVALPGSAAILLPKGGNAYKDVKICDLPEEILQALLCDTFQKPTAPISGNMPIQNVQKECVNLTIDELVDQLIDSNCSAEITFLTDHLASEQARYAINSWLVEKALERENLPNTVEPFAMRQAIRPLPHVEGIPVLGIPGSATPDELLLKLRSASLSKDDMAALRTQRIFAQKKKFLALETNEGRREFLSQESRCGIYSVALDILKDANVQKTLQQEVFRDDDTLASLLLACMGNPPGGMQLASLDLAIFSLACSRLEDPPSLAMRSDDFFPFGAKPYTDECAEMAKKAAIDNGMVRREMARLLIAVHHQLSENLAEEFFFNPRQDSFTNPTNGECSFPMSAAAHCLQHAPDIFLKKYADHLSDEEFTKLLQRPGLCFGRNNKLTAPLLALFLTANQSDATFPIPSIVGAGKPLGATNRPAHGTFPFPLTQQRQLPEGLHGGNEEILLMERLEKMANNPTTMPMVRSLLRSLLHTTQLTISNGTAKTGSAMSVWLLLGREFYQSGDTCILSSNTEPKTKVGSDFVHTASITPHAGERLQQLLQSTKLLDKNGVDGNGNRWIFVPMASAHLMRDGFYVDPRSIVGHFPSPDGEKRIVIFLDNQPDRIAGDKFT
ncbi:MAG: hypothetical protein LBP65_01975 [Puniceicoccales bacterium]|nr:hypothetical protein [Puniceicoccales bacterium]